MSHVPDRAHWLTQAAAAGMQRARRMCLERWLSAPLLRAFWRRRLAALGLLGLLTVAAIAVLAAWLAPYPPQQGVAAPLLAPSRAHWFGTDDLGRDLFSNVVYGARVALIIGLVSATAASGIGVAVGLLAGFAGGMVDEALMRLTELFQMLPRFFLALLLAAIFGSSIWWVAMLIAITSWPGMARLLRAEVLSVRSREYIQAAIVTGAPAWRIMLRHILPNAHGPVVVAAARLVAAAIITEAGLSFLGLGDPSVVSWGQMLNNAQRFIRQAWWTYVFPGAALTATVLCVTFVADGVLDALRPHLRQHLLPQARANGSRRRARRGRPHDDEDRL